jgi:hypothetical protein
VSRAGADRHSTSGERPMGRLYVFGKLRQSEDDGGFYVETAEGGCWLLHLAWLATDEIDRMLHMRVIVEGGRIGAATVAVSRISEADALNNDIGTAPPPAPAPRPCSPPGTPSGARG